MDKKTQINFWYVMLAVFGILMFQDWWTASRQVEVMPYSRFEELLAKGDIEEVFIRQKRLEGKLKVALQDGRQYFVTNRVEPQLAERLGKQGVKFSGVVESTFLRDLLSWILPVLFFFALWMFLVRRMAEKQGFGGLMNVGKSKAKVYVEKYTKTRFEDVAGVPSFSISGSEFVEMFVGVGAARVRICSNRPPRPLPASSLSTNWMPWAGFGASGPWAATTRRSRPSTSC